MQFADDDTIRAYRAAWESWRKQLDHLHRVFLDGEAIGPAQVKGLLNREARAKDEYDAARARLLGLSETEDAAAAASPDVNPFR